MLSSIFSEQKYPEFNSQLELATAGLLQPLLESIEFEARVLSKRGLCLPAMLSVQLLEIPFWLQDEFSADIPVTLCACQVGIPNFFSQKE